jgi:hypothetical protein
MLSVSILLKNAAEAELLPGLGDLSRVNARLSVSQVTVLLVVESTT